MKSKKQLWIWMCLCLFMAVMTSCKRQLKEMPVGGNYKTIQVVLSNRTLYSTYAATIQGKQDVDIYPQVSGLITAVCVEEGAEVKKGQTLFVIDQVPYRAALEMAEANVASAEAAVATARMTVDSKEMLYEERVISDFDLQSARNSLSQQEAALAQARAELTDAQNNLSYTEVKSPVDGTAGMIPYRIGTLVSSSISNPLVSVSDNKEMHIYFSMTEKQILALARRNGSLSNALAVMPEVELVLSDNSHYTEKGKVDAISGIIDTKTGSVTVRATFPNPERVLLSGGTGRVLLPYTRENCIVIPQEATFELQDKVFVYKIVNGVTKSTMITVSPINNGQEYIVESGLELGDVIIATGAGILRDGISVGVDSQVKEGGETL